MDELVIADEVRYALDENPSPLLASADVAEVLRYGVYSPEGGGSAEVAAIVRSTAGGIFAVEGGCDYTGWDCQSSADVYAASSVYDAWLNGITADGRALIERDEAARG